MRGLEGIRPLPRHWREFIKVMLDTFVFRLDEDRPLGHLPADEQGFAGEATAERLRWIRHQIAELTATVQKQPTKEGLTARNAGAGRYVLAANVFMRPASTAAVAISLPDERSGATEEHMFPASMVGLLSQFLEPRSLEEIVAEVRRSGLSIGDEEILEPFIELIERRVLLSADAVD
jgi:hypothetical protein